MDGGKTDTENLLRRSRAKIRTPHGVDHADALRAVGDVDWCIQIVEKDADDFAEPQRDNGEVIAAQAQGGARPAAHRKNRPEAHQAVAPPIPANGKPNCGEESSA